MSFRENLLKQEAPLDSSEVEELQAWLDILKRDCAVFGIADEDRVRMNAIKARLAREQA